MSVSVVMSVRPGTTLSEKLRNEHNTVQNWNLRNYNGIDSQT